MGYRHRNNREGFWAGQYNQVLPKPVASEEAWVGKQEFIDKLRKLEVDEGTNKLHFKGFSRCRICNKINGTSTFVAQGWEWPSGYRHYIEEHNVRPSLAFQEMVLLDHLGE